MNEEALEALLARGEAGDADAQHQLGNVWQQGRFGRADIDQAMTWYERASEQGHRDASFNLGLIGLRVLPGMNRPPRPDLAVPALERAIDAGDEQAHPTFGRAPGLIRQPSR